MRRFMNISRVRNALYGFLFLNTSDKSNELRYWKSILFPKYKADVTCLAGAAHMTSVEDGDENEYTKRLQ